MNHARRTRGIAGSIDAAMCDPKRRNMRRAAQAWAIEPRPIDLAVYPDSTKIEIPCTCGRNTKKTIGWIKQNDELVCGCGVHINLRTATFKR